MIFYRFYQSTWSSTKKREGEVTFGECTNTCNGLATAHDEMTHSKTRFLWVGNARARLTSTIP